MENARKVEEQAAQVPVVPTIATTPFMPIIPTPVPIWTPEMANQFYSHSNGIPAGFDLPAFPEISNWPNHRLEPSPFAHHNAANRVQISFDSFPSSSNGITQLLTQPDLPLAYSAVTNEGQFVPPYNSQFIPTTYTSFQHYQLPVEQPFLNTLHNQYVELPGPSYFDYCSKTFAEIAPHEDDVIAAETRKDAATPMTIEERNREGEDKNNTSTTCYNPHNKINGPTTKVAAVPAAKEDIRRNFDLNKTPQAKQPKRRKHRAKVVKEGQPKRTIKKAAAETVQSKENQADKRKARKGLNTTSPQTEVTGEWTSGPKSTVHTCKRSLRFGSKEQAIDDPGRRENMLFANASSSRNWVADHNGLQECPNNSIGRDAWSTGCGLQAVGSKRKQPGIEQADNTSINMLGAQYNDMKAYCLNYGVQFPNVHKKRRSVKGRTSEAPRKSSVTATRDVQLATFLQDARSHSYMSSPKCWASGSDYTAAGVPVLISATEGAIQDKHQPLENTLSLGQKRPTKRRSRASTRTDVGLAHTAKQTCSSDRRTFGDAEGPQTCIDALVADLGASLTKRKRTGKNRVSYASSCKNERQDNTLACVDKGKEIVDKNVDALTEQFIFLNINREARDSHGQYMHEHESHGAIVPYKPKKRSIRAKVDIDEETNKVWALLLENINNSGIDGSDAEKTIWWEQERKVYRGRAEAFIAKMHQVQGDRGFSMWKGSVVDSVVGVFLTQNVSDHLSSSAFMALAARFPLKSTNTCHKESTSSDKESTGPVESGTINAMTEEGQNSLCQGSIKKGLHNIISSKLAGVVSQTSGDFPIDQNPEKVGSFSDSISEIEDLTSTAQFNIYYNRTSFRELLEMASDQFIDLNHDNQIGNLEKSDAIPYTSETPATKEYTLEVTTKEYTLEVTRNSGALEVNCCDPRTIESDSKAGVANSQEQTQEPKQKEREKDVVNPNHEKRKGEGKKKSASVKPKSKKEDKKNFDWDSLRVQAQAQAGKREKTEKTMDSVDWDAVRRADVNEISKTIKERGMNNMLAERIQNFLNLLVDKHKGIDLEWLRDVPPDQAKDFLLSIRGLGLKSVECIRLLTLHHLAFPVDTNVGRIVVRLGWVPIQPLPESLQLHVLELYPVLDAVQKYLWPRLCKLDQRTLYELHYQLITFGKVFCTKSKPNCNACPMRGECRHFASAFASARLALPGPEEERMPNTTGNNATERKASQVINQTTLLLHENPIEGALQQNKNVHPIVEVPASPDPERSKFSQGDIEDAFKKDSFEIPDIKVDMTKFALSIRNYVQQNMELQEGEMSKALVALNPDVACIPTPKLKNVSKLRTEHYVYELPDSHPLLKGWQTREPDDPGKYLLAIWTPGETAESIQPPERKCSSQDSGQLCKENECYECNSFREVNSKIIRGTILIPCRTAMRGSFPLNGTYFQVNEVFADNESSLNPISVPRSWIWNLGRRTVYFGTSVSSIFKGLSTQDIQQCFWRGYVCVRGFDRERRAPRPLLARLHFTASRTPKTPKKKGNTEKMLKQQSDLNKIKNQPELFSSIQETSEAPRQ